MKTIKKPMKKSKGMSTAKKVKSVSDGKTNKANYKTSKKKDK